MKILYIQDSLGAGGAERSNAELWYYLRKKGVRLKIAVLEHRTSGVEKEILDKGFDVVFLKKGSFWSHVTQVKQIIEDFQPDIVHSVLFKAALRTRFAKLKTKFINIESLVNCTYDKIRYKDPKVNARLLKVYEFVDRYTAKFGVDHFVAITKEVKSHYEKHLMIKPTKISVIYRGRKKNNFITQKAKLRSRVVKELNLNPNGPIFIHVGRQEFQKAHLDILKAIKIVDRELSDSNAQFLFCGRKGNSTKEIENFLTTNDLKTTIKFLGHRNDIYELLVAADIFVFPSLFEGLGGSLIEAQAAGLPLICSDIPVFQEVVTKDNAVFHQTNDPTALSTQLTGILNRDLIKMGEKSLENYEKNFRLEGVNQQMLELYHSIPHST
ncbi:Glycosyltransferase involved in cell wall bisynthesis [Salinimicrobium catena]|uniref:Glycosyltransferase involved in cell wall bisynthesis n=1 Tax=Salinimicrobium catena TaxID=390640 RepID=A0A1H5LLV6_9FLAO|nr:glycosyltransferase family 4 protein [Salinimicrobium catena]SDL11068.1 Glycosyltransferase involved in cell wall bisynthesis [Salinimicrobium catena]SEE77507.1 Glycosyltransferase involved in cell wall bisynthesis [Salinimicrobium catena]